MTTMDLSADLNDAEWAALDAALLSGPACDATWLDGYWAGLTLQPEPPDAAQAVAVALGVDALPPLVHALGQRRMQALSTALRSQGWWDPFIRAPQDEALAAAATGAEPAATPEALAGTLGPWVAGLEQALHDFPLEPEPASGGEPDPAWMMVLARLYRHLPAQGAQEQALVELLNQAHPLASLEDAVDELTACVAELWDLSRPAPPN